MARTQLAAVERLRSLGQSVWIDDLSREMLATGSLATLRQEGVTGITANPTTFDKAVTGAPADFLRLPSDRPVTGADALAIIAARP